MVLRELGEKLDFSPLDIIGGGRVDVCQEGCQDGRHSNDPAHARCSQKCCHVGVVITVPALLREQTKLHQPVGCDHSPSVPVFVRLQSLGTHTVYHHWARKRHGQPRRPLRVLEIMHSSHYRLETGSPEPKHSSDGNCCSFRLPSIVGKASRRTRYHKTCTDHSTHPYQTVISTLRATLSLTSYSLRSRSGGLLSTNSMSKSDVSWWRWWSRRCTAHCIVLTALGSMFESVLGSLITRQVQGMASM